MLFASSCDVLPPDTGGAYRSATLTEFASMVRRFLYRPTANAAVKPRTPSGVVARVMASQVGLTEVLVSV